MDKIETILFRGAQEGTAKDDPVHIRWQRNHKIEPVKLLQLLEQQLTAELPKIVLNYQGIQSTCWRLLVEIEADIHGECEHWLASQSIPSVNIHTRLHLLGYYLLHDAMKSSKPSPPPRPYVSERAIQEGSGIPRRDMLSRAERVIRRCLLEEGFDNQPRGDGVFEELIAS